MAGANYSKGDSDFVFLGITTVVVAFLGSWLVWEALHTDLVYWSAWVNWHILTGFSWIWSPTWLTELRNGLGAMAASAPTVTPGQLWAMSNRAGYVLLPLLLFVLAGLARKMHRHPSNSVRRPIDPDKLRWIMAEHAPAIIPTLYYPNLLENDPPEHRSMEAPDEWVLSNRLIVNQRLDRKRTESLLMSALGRPIQSLQDLAPHERALFAVFGARLLSDGADLAVAQDLLDRLNRSCHQGTFEGRRGYPNLTIAESYFTKYAAHPEAAEWLSHFRYSRTLLYAMHLAAIQKGKVPSSHFVWLRSMDRGLWAALNTTGRKTPFVESLAVFTQARWEIFAKSLGLSLAEPHLADAVDALNAYLEKVGLVTPTPKSTNA